MRAAAAAALRRAALYRCGARHGLPPPCTMTGAAPGIASSPAGQLLLFRALAGGAKKGGNGGGDPLGERLLNLRDPAGWYPASRAMRRKIVLHVGGTNSGKTHNALAALMRAESGVYCGPLRLLAWEVAETLNSAGTPCDLVTGQERREVAGAAHVSCTVEMASTSREYDVGVIDEVQLLGDRDRGWAFTRALLGVPARELHVCGAGEAEELVARLAADAGDDLEVRRYERLSPLTVQRSSVGTLGKIRKGDCVVAFSRRRVHELKRMVEGYGAHRCSIVYGSLPPEARSTQAELFNSKRTGYNVLVASDAVGMGLNLNIRRIVFSALEKFDGERTRALLPAEVKQIAGRAGRFGSSFPEGKVTCVDPSDMPLLRASMVRPTPPVPAAGLQPPYEQLALFAARRPEGLHGALSEFLERATTTGHYFVADCESQLRWAEILQDLDLDLPDLFTFCISPADPDDTAVARALVAFASEFQRKGRVPISLVGAPPLHCPRHHRELQRLEEVHRVLDLYLWLGFRFGCEIFPDREAAASQRELCSALVEEGLRALSVLGRPDKGAGGAASAGG